MSSILSCVSKGVVFFCDLIATVDQMEKRQQAEGNGDKWVHSAFLANKVAMLGFTCAEAGALMKGASSETLHKLKVAELLPRLANLPICIFNGANAIDGTSFKDFLRFWEKGFIAPQADLIRVLAEMCHYHEKTILDLPSEENKISPNELEQHQNILNTTREVAAKAALVRGGAEIGAVSKTFDASKSIYAVLAKFIHETRHNLSDEEDIQGALNLMDLPYIPSILHKDEVFQSYICPITFSPIRCIMGDPNGRTYYEKSAILEWLQVNPVSPCTREPLFAHQLVSQPGIQALINHRLKFHEQKLRKFVREYPEVIETIIAN